MNRKASPNSKVKRGVQIFSDLMLMKFRPKAIQGSKKVIQSNKMDPAKTSPEKRKSNKQQQKNNLLQAIKHIRYLQLASKDSVILGDYNQLDMIDLQGLTHGFVDTFHYWSLCIQSPILDMKVNTKQQVIIILSVKKLLLYSYTSIKREKSSPILANTVDLRQNVKFMQFSTSDSIALFYQSYFQIYSLNQSNFIQKKVQKKYNIDLSKFSLFSVPQSIDNTINVFLQEKLENKKLFGLWCIQINLMTQNVKQNPPYKIYDIMTSLKSCLILENYSKDVIFLNLGQEILVAKKGYIVDSVNINIKLQEAYLRYLPNRKVLVHIEHNIMQTYSFKLNTNILPHRIELTPIDSMEIVKPRLNCKMIGLVPIFQSNYAIFYEQNSKMTTRGEIFYSFMVSYTVNLQSKINLILATDKPISQLSSEELDRKCDILKKIGLKEREIYLQIWRRSTKSSIKDYQLLLSTRHYKTIKNEIENKLRKTSLSFKQVYKIEESCLQILRNKINGQKCNEQDLQDYITCHLLKRKLDLHRELEYSRNPRQSQQDKIFYLNIQDYYTLKNMELKQFVLQRIAQHPFADDQGIKQIRIILYHFRFIYRFIYPELLEQIVKLVKNQLKTLLLVLPQLLPIDDEVQQSLKEGVWKQISVVQWEHSLYNEKLANIYNKQILEQLIKGVWFKRNWLTIHDVVPLQTEQIRKKNQENNSVDIFYFFTEKVIQNIKEIEILKKVLSHVEATYSKFPQHLKAKVLLYSNIYEYYMKNCQLVKLPKVSLAQLLTYKDYNLFKIFFEFQKVRKNCLLKQIITIYQKSVENGFELFNLSLFNYFKSDVSEISHMKYLLNRINNQKKQFHANHQKMYYVLVKAMQIKLKLGSQNDIPVDQVLIYIQNIPVASYEHQQMIKQLQTIQKISDQSQTFKSMKINMTIREIIDKYEQVMEKLVDYQIAKYDLMKFKNREEIVNKSYRILAEIQSLKNNIYGQGYPQLAFFIYLTRLMQHQDKIHIANDLINDEYLNRYYYIDLNTIENLVRYMYKWKFSQNSAFLPNSEYIILLLDLLADDNNFKQYALFQLKFAQLLSCSRQLVTYPLSSQSRYPRLCQLEQIIKFMDQNALRRVDFQEVAQTMKKLQDLSKVVFSDSKTIVNLSISSEKIQDYSLYEVVIKVMITRGMIKEVIPLIKNSIKVTTNYDVITILILIYRILSELNEDSKILITKIASHLYSQPEQLLQIVEKLMGGPFTGLQAISYLKGQYDKVKEKYLNYDPENIIFNIYFIHLNEQGTNNLSKRILVKNTLLKLKKCRQEFLHDYLFDFLYIILCHDPQAIAILLKFVQTYKYKLMRSFMSYLIQEQIFDQINTLEVLKRTSYYLLKSLKENADIYNIVRQYGTISLLEEFKFRKYQDLNQLQKKIEKNLKAFERKKQKVCKLQRSQRMKKLNYIIIDKQASIRQSLKNVESIKDKQQHQYIFSDSDNDYELEEPTQTLKPQQFHRKNKHSKIVFDPMNQRKRFYKTKKAVIPETAIKATVISPIKHSATFDATINKKLGEEIIKECLQKGNKTNRRYFGMDVRSGYDPEEGNPDFSGIVQKPITQSRRNSNQRQNLNKSAEIQHVKSAGILAGVRRKPDRKNSQTSSKKKKMILTKSFDENMLAEHMLVSLGLSNRKSQEEKSQKNSNTDNNLAQKDQMPQKDVQINKPKIQEKAKIQVQTVANDNKTNQQNKQELKTTKQAVKNIKVAEEKSQSPVKSLQQIKDKNENQDSQALLKKIYKTFNPRLENEPYNLKALALQRGQNANNFKKTLKKIIQQAYLKPQKTYEISLKFILQIAKKYPQCEVNTAYAQTYERIAKYQAKYGLDLPMQEILPLRGLFLKKQDLFENIKENIFQVCTHQNLFKISKLVSIGFKKNTLQQQIITGYLQKALNNLNSIEDLNDQTLELEKIKALANKLTVRVLIQRAQNSVTQIQESGLKKKVLQMFVDIIKLKGNAKEAKEIASKYK